MRDVDKGCARDACGLHAYARLRGNEREWCFMCQNGAHGLVLFSGKGGKLRPRDAMFTSGFGCEEALSSARGGGKLLRARSCAFFAQVHAFFIMH